MVGDEIRNEVRQALLDVVRLHDTTKHLLISI